ncbi:MAG: carbohydrate ABC transporter permease [Oscillospiraceae bacterium]|jgi:ABC-type glycerol-3-phosphate transport system permease component|nr:carbohydrate ABC transporter permease [Oscillospiraceae bacterium]
MRAGNTAGDNVFIGLTTALLVMIGILVLYPLVYVLSASFSSPEALMAARVTLWPVEVTLDGYRAVFSTNRILMGYSYTLLYMAVGTVIGVVMNLVAAYPLSRPDFKGRNAIMALFAFTMFFSGGMIPGYLLIRDLRIMNTMWALTLPGAVNVWNIIVIRTFYQTNISIELLEAAQIDGCGNRYFFIRCVLPLSGAIIAVMGLFTAVGYWNSYMSALLYLNDSSRYPLQLVLREILIQNTQSTVNSFLADAAEQDRRVKMEFLLKYGIIVVSSAPVLTLYPLAQRHFVKGVMIGSLKG